MRRSCRFGRRRDGRRRRDGCRFRRRLNGLSDLDDGLRLFYVRIRHHVDIRSAESSDNERARHIYGVCSLGAVRIYRNFVDQKILVGSDRLLA